MIQMEGGHIKSLFNERGFFSVRSAPLSSLIEIYREKICRLRVEKIESYDWMSYPYGTVIMGALPVASPPIPEHKPDRPVGHIAPFAQKNYYREAVQRLQSAAAAIRDAVGIKKQDIRIFVNSNLPEKEIAEALGVGFIGKNSLLITRDLGSRCILAGMLLHNPDGRISKIEDDSRAPVTNGCGSCAICLQQCPTDALVAPGIVDQTACIQSIASRNVLVSPEVMTRWDARLYGCQSCQDLCPFNRHAITGAETNIGVIGSTIALEDLLVSSGEQLSSRFKSTVLGMRWISCEAIQRNGLIAAGNLKAHTLLPLLRSFKKAESAVLQRTAKWAEERIEREPGG